MLTVGEKGVGSLLGLLATASDPEARKIPLLVDQNIVLLLPEDITCPELHRY
jgi:hypothetical protein